MDDRHQQRAYPLRISDQLRAALQSEADKGPRSLNAEIALRLERSLAPPEAPAASTVESINLIVAHMLALISDEEIARIRKRMRSTDTA